MSKKPFKSQASSSRAVSGAFVRSDGAINIGSFGPSPAFGTIPSSSLSYVYEPPDLSSISEPNVVVALKNLQKKDSTTKSKALEDLQAYILTLAVANGGVEDAILEAWIKIYPRASIDSARRVRQLAHQLQGQISVLCGKRIVKYIPSIVSSWLAGLYDNDKVVVRTTRDSLARVFTSEEKLKSLWRIYQSSILGYAENVVSKETVFTLSDERTTSPDDASAKYARTAGAAISMVANIIDELSSVDNGKTGVKVDEFLKKKEVWKFASDPDPYLRLAVYRLATATFTKFTDSIDLRVISDNVLISSLNISQAGSALKYVTTLALLTSRCPDIWTQYYSGSGKKSAVRKLCQFLRRGSQGGPPEYWGQIKTIVQHLPTSVILPELEGDCEIVKAQELGTPVEPPLLEALRGGITSKEEPKDHHSAAWNTYLDVCSRLLKTSSSQNYRDYLAKSSIAPIVSAFVIGNPIDLEWTILGPNQHAICVRAFCQVLHVSVEIFQEEWRRLSSQIIENFQKSLPEQSKDYKTSQDLISGQIRRWYKLQSTILKEQDLEVVRSLISTTLESEIKASTSTLRERNGKPYSAAAILVNATELLPELLRNCHQTKELVVDFAHEDVPKLLLSSSAALLITALGRLEDITNVRSIYEAAIRDLRNAPESTAKSSALAGFVSSPFLAKSTKYDALTVLVKENLVMAKHGDESRWNLVMTALGNPDAPRDLTDELLADMTNSLSTEEDISACLEGLQLTIKRNARVMKGFVQSQHGPNILSKLLFLTESPDITIREKAHTLSTAIEAILSNEKGSNLAIDSIIEIINQGIETAGQDSLSIDALVAQAVKVLNQNSGRDVAALTADLLPSKAQWTTALNFFILQKPNPSISIMEPFSGAIHLIQSAPLEVGSISRDLDGYSPLLRMAWYAAKLVRSSSIYDHTTDDQRTLLFHELAITSRLAAQNLSIPGSIPVWESKDPDTEYEIHRFVGVVRSLQSCWVRDFQASSNVFVNAAMDLLIEDCRTSLASSYYCASAYLYTMTELTIIHGDFPYDDKTILLDEMSKPVRFFAKAAILATSRNTKVLSKFCNKLVDDLTGNKSEDPDDFLRHLVLLNCILRMHEDGFLAKIPKQRLIFLVKHLISQVDTSKTSFLEVPPHVLSETMKVLIAVLEPLKETYGAFWEQLLGLVLQTWLYPDLTHDNHVPALFAGLQLYEQLKKLSHEESNDDLCDAWAENQASLQRGLLQLLINLSGTLPLHTASGAPSVAENFPLDIPDSSHEPRKMLNELLARQLENFSGKFTLEDVDLYPVLASESLSLQLSAYEILHQKIPEVQEQASLEKALSKDFISKLPEELLSLILAAPRLESPAEVILGSDVNPVVQSYLLSWKLVYDHWTNSSSALKADYAASLKDGAYLEGLLDFAFDILINKRSKQLDASQFEVSYYNPRPTETAENNTHWLIIHLYYLSLKHLPVISKVWWRDTTSRQKVIAVEAWTEKYISPRIIASELNAVSEWAPSQATSEPPLSIKISSSTREITASIPIDDQFMQIAVRLPPSYPLSRATVDSIHRVAVDEKKWHSWIMTTQGVINFSSAGDECALIDGLQAWSKNVNAAMKGQTECAICYSVVSQDKQLPGKKCATCKKLFHGSCLFRWFKSSNSSSCPLCRTDFNYV